ncbi:hypothetical protein [Rhodovulum sulfidophilum]|nr:hypothetical protein [Rhodovulum sulfidophilum]
MIHDGHIRAIDSKSDRLFFWRDVSFARSASLAGFRARCNRDDRPLS